MAMAWSETLSSGVDDIDTQHKELIQRVNRLLEIQTTTKFDREAVSKIIAYLTEYVVFHFNTEETLMDRHTYSSASAHKAQHAQFVKVFLRLKDRLLMEGITPSLSQETRELVVDWLLNHIKFSDRALGMYLKQKK